MYRGIQLQYMKHTDEKIEGNRLYFWSNDQVAKEVKLLTFSSSENHGPKIECIDSDIFEKAYLSGEIGVAPTQFTLPPWLQPNEGLSLTYMDSMAEDCQRKPSEIATSRLELILPFVDQFNELPNQKNWEKIVNGYAREIGQNSARFRGWLMAYGIHGNNLMALAPAFGNIGHWDRSRFPGVKFGRPYLDGSLDFPWPVDALMLDQILAAYADCWRPGKSLKKIYYQGLVEVFGCKVQKLKNGTMVVVHPLKRPFPSWPQFRDHIYEWLGEQEFKKSRYGQSRARQLTLASEGKFSEAVRNVMERCESDGAYTKVHPAGILHGTAQESFCVIRIVCDACGLRVGIGFSIGKETISAYRMALFSMYIDKVDFCRYFGITISGDEWPSIGGPSMGIFDRGPGASENLMKRAAAGTMPIRELTPTAEGQSKASVEAAHPRETKLLGTKQYFLSSMSAIKLAKVEILGLLRDNQKSDASARMTEEMHAEGVMPNPLGIWKFLDDRARNSAISISKDNAIRAFLRPITLSVMPDGLYLRCRRFTANRLKSEGILERLLRQGVKQLNGYCLELCVRYLWVEVYGEIIELEATLSLKDNDEQLYISLSDLELLSDQAAEKKSGFRRHQDAAGVAFEATVREETGHRSDGGRVVSGRRKRSEKTQTDSEAMKQGMRGTS